LLLYLLHFDQPIGGKIHYGGSCQDEQLLTRLRRHQCGTGSRTTRRVHLEGVGFHLAAVIRVENRSAEKTWKNAKRYRRDCYICCSSTPDPDLFPVGSYFAPVAISDTGALSSREPFHVGWNLGHEKRRKP
jgi:predicted GIY-YIG superfamily endonuclease